MNTNIKNLNTNIKTSNMNINTLSRADAVHAKSRIAAAERARIAPPDTRLSEHFTLREFTDSGTARLHNIDNTPQPIHIERLRALCQQSLEPLRRRFGAIRVTSGYRSQRLNALVGGAPTSQHTMGEAADIPTGGRETSQKMYDYARQHVPYDQLILERKVSHGTYWLHLSLRSDRPGNRREAFQLTVK